MKRFVSLPCDDRSGRLSKVEMAEGIREMRSLVDQGVIEIDADIDNEPEDLVWVTDRVLPPEDRALWDEMAAKAKVVRIKLRK